MADIFVQCCFAFSCSPAEMSLLEECFQASQDLAEDCMPDGIEPSPAMRAIFPGRDGDCWAGLRDIFPDRGYPTLGAYLTGSNLADPATVCAIVTGETDFEPGAVAQLIQRCCPTTLRDAPFGFEWSVTSSRMRVGEFGGGWCAIFPDRIAMMTTGEALAAALAATPAPSDNPGTSGETLRSLPASRG